MTDWKYSVGFMFDPEGRNVALIKKSKPRWQAGRWNGIGGKIEPLESPLQAMVREFREETGVETVEGDWQNTIFLYNENFNLHVFRAFSEKVHEVKTTTEEEVRVWMVNDAITVVPTINNLKWLIPFQLDTGLAVPLSILDGLPTG